MRERIFSYAVRLAKNIFVSFYKLSNGASTLTETGLNFFSVPSSLLSLRRGFAITMV
jgi:hypothetical protein